MKHITTIGELREYAKYVRDSQPHDDSMAGASDQSDGAAVLGALADGDESLAWSSARAAGWNVGKRGAIPA